MTRQSSRGRRWVFLWAAAGVSLLGAMVGLWFASSPPEASSLVAPSEPEPAQPSPSVPKTLWTIRRASDGPAPDGPAPPASIRVASDQGKGRVSGRVVTADGDPVPDAQIGASSEEDSSFVSSDSEGRFELGGLSANVVNVFATAQGLAARQARAVPVGTSDLVLVLDEPAALKGSLGASALPPRSFVRLCHHDPDFDREVCVKSEYYVLPTSEFELTRLPSGDFDLVFATEDEELARVPVRLAAGRTLELSSGDLPAIPQ